MRLTKSHVISGVLAVALLGATATAWYFAAQARTPAQRAEETEAPEDSVITVRVEAGQLIDTMEFTAVLDRTGDVAVPAPATPPEGVETALASKLPLEVGDEVNAGTVLLEVSGRPMIAMYGAVPAYRDLAEGDKGPDVEQLQNALSWIYGTPATGTFDSRTASDLRKLYQNLGYEAATTTETVETDGGEPGGENGEPGGEDGEPGGSTQTTEVEKVRLPASEVVFLESLPMQVGKIEAKQSAPLDGNVMTLVSGDWKLEAELTNDEAGEVSKYGDDIELEYGSGPLAGTEVGVPELVQREVADEGDGGGWPGEGEENSTTEKTFAVFSFDEKDVEDKDLLVPGAEQSVTLVRARSAEDALIIPLSALWTDSGGKTMLTVLEEDQTERHIEVEVTLRHEGRGVVEALDGELAADEEVVVAWRDRGNG